MLKSKYPDSVVLNTECAENPQLVKCTLLPYHCRKVLNIYLFFQSNASENQSMKDVLGGYGAYLNINSFLECF